ncbi:hypothetical protein BDF21DRAFT_403014 [Thamnidium elegans]|nr:hypothetical protein BDF21DRAFT_403014 [Thamnidium elegans]
MSVLEPSQASFISGFKYFMVTPVPERESLHEKDCIMCLLVGIISSFKSILSNYIPESERVQLNKRRLIASCEPTTSNNAALSSTAIAASSSEIPSSLSSTITKTPSAFTTGFSNNKLGIVELFKHYQYTADTICKPVTLEENIQELLALGDVFILGEKPTQQD